MKSTLFLLLPTLAFDWSVLPPSWVAAVGMTGLLCFFAIRGDSRWVRVDKYKDDSERTKEDIASLTSSLKTLEGTVSTGFTNLSGAIERGVLSLTKDVACIQGRLAGAVGMGTKPE